MREFLSQTTDLSSFCYLTDGGHFDNTGLYSLVQRGCRHIVVVDCGADPKPPRFEDLGDALRRCRIDFGTEIDLSLDCLIPDDADSSKGEKSSTVRPFSFGTITYSIPHAKQLGWIVEDQDHWGSRNGWILWVKPSLISRASGDVLQYGFAHGDFPQQSTANQWFDEAQFESYRKLGEQTAKAIFGKMKVFGEMAREPESAVFSPAEADWLFSELRAAHGH
jgi:hypothetical protein